MVWYRDLYAGESIARKKSKIKWKIQHNAGQVNIFVISLASKQGDLLEIISAVLLMQKGYPKENMFIVGIASGFEEAQDLACRIILDIYEKTGNFNVRKYLKEHHNAKDKGNWPCL